MAKFIVKSLQAIVFLLCIAVVMSCRGGTILNSGVPYHERAIILEAHNKLRASVAMGRVPGQPGAENMREMVWDEELAAKAQEWANQCTFKHDPHRTVDRFTMGQNMAIIWSTEPLAEDDGDFPSRIQNWFNEVQKYAFGAGWSPKTGHYSQLVWGETNLVGCGFTYYKDSKKYNKLYVCNYGPGGNVVGYNPYEIGKPACSNHGMHPSHKYQGLCSTNAGSSGGGSQQNAINTYYKPASQPAYNAYNTKSYYWQQQQQQYQQQQQQYQQQQQQYQQQQQQYQQQQQQYQQQQKQQQHQQHQNTQQKNNYNSDSGFKTSFFKFTNIRKPNGAYFRWGTQV